jgi:hypothetical protein
MELNSPLWLVENSGDCNFGFSLSLTLSTVYFNRVLPKFHFERLVLGKRASS